jgi:hypothetical protein
LDVEDATGLARGAPIRAHDRMALESYFSRTSLSHCTEDEMPNPRRSFLPLSEETFPLNSRAELVALTLVISNPW